MDTIFMNSENNKLLNVIFMLNLTDKIDLRKYEKEHCFIIY